MMKVLIKKLHPDALVPKYQTYGAAGFDLSTIDEIHIQSGETVIARTGLAFEIPEGYELEVRPRSGISSKTKIRLSNSPGTIDSDYRGEVKFILDLLMTRFPGKEIIPKGTRLAQGLLKKVERAEFEETQELSETVRGDKGLGSSGV